MGLSSNGQSLLHKLGRKLAYEMSSIELDALVAADQKRRTIARAVARTSKLLAEKPKAKTRSKRAAILDTYVAPAIAIALRKKWPNKSDPELISMLQGKGVL